MQRTRLIILIALVCTWFGTVCVSSAADVNLVVSATNVYVGEPFEVTIEVEDADERPDPPTIELPEGLRKVGPIATGSSSMTRIVNGVVTREEKTTYTQRIMPLAPGEFTIPPMSMSVDGVTYTTERITIRATKSEVGDLLQLRVRANDQEDKTTFYLGESIELTLEIWVKQFVSPRAEFEADQFWTWELVDRGASNFGVFGEMQGEINYRFVPQSDEKGESSDYYVYELTGRVTPRQTGELQLGNIIVKADYPQSVRRERDFFNRRIAPANTRPIVQMLDNTAITIVSPPEANRPLSFNGAVGRFDLEVSAEPRSAAVGEPITLTIDILDRTATGAQLEYVQAPPLEKVPALTERFQIPDDPLAGVVAGKRKTFTQTIRAKNDSVDAIPPIAFSYFNPRTERYETVSSDAIPIQIAAAETMIMSDVVGGVAGDKPTATELTEVEGGLLPNDVGDQLLVSYQPFTLHWAHLAGVAAPPFFFVIGLIAVRRSRRMKEDEHYGRRRHAKRRAIRRIESTQRTDEPEALSEMAEAISDYVADRQHAPLGAMTVREVVDRLQTANVEGDLIERVRDLLIACEQTRYSGESSMTRDEAASAAQAIINELERVRL